MGFFRIRTTLGLFNTVGRRPDVMESLMMKREKVW